MELRDELGGNKELVAFREKYHNISLEEILLSKRESDKIKEYRNTLIREDEPIYKAPDNNFGRAQFFASDKKVISVFINTYWFNLLILFFMALIFYLILIYEGMRKIFNFFAVCGSMYAAKYAPSWRIKKTT